jgi:hypothetical protein
MRSQRLTDSVSYAVNLSNYLKEFNYEKYWQTGKGR